MDFIKHISIVISLIIFILNSYHASLLADEVITEEYIVNILNGNTMDSSYIHSDKDKPLLNNMSGVSCNIIFNENSTEISSDSYNTLAAIGRSLESSTLNNFNFMIIGYTDSKGSEGDTITLPLTRAENVKKFLIANFSLRNERLIVKVKEESFPTDLNDSESGKGDYQKIDVIMLR
ncbi:MAG: OmpA family protein [Candidatus Scalindua sp.]|nr:OmpA family protein [Candidatus Scalindua sp.]